MPCLGKASIDTMENLSLRRIPCVTVFRAFTMTLFLVFYLLVAENRFIKEEEFFEYPADEAGIFFSSNDFDITRAIGSNDIFRISDLFSTQIHKLIRAPFFDRSQQIVLTQILALFTRTAYIQTLSPVWQPSIPVAHRKLII
jgi:hypothetical protein